MTTSHLSTLPEKSVQFCSVTRDFEVQVNGRIVGYASTELRGYQMANEYVYNILSANYPCSADLSQDDADGLLAAHLVDLPPMIDLEVQPDNLLCKQFIEVEESHLPITHPILQLVNEAAWLVSHPRFAA
jgi:hypothetical protein